MSIYMKIEGIEGSVTTKSYKGWMSLNSVKKTITRSDKTLRHSNTQIVIADFVIQKPIDDGSPSLFNRACLGQTIPKIIIMMCSKSNNEKPILEYTLYDVIINKLDEINIKDQQTSEEWHLTFSAIHQKQMSYDTAGAPRPPKTSGFDMKHGLLL